MTTTLERLLRFSADRYQRPRASLSADADLFQSLDIDSVEVLELVTELERAFGARISDLELLDVRSFADLAALLERSS